MSQNQNILDKLPPKTHGKKLLMTLKNAQNIYNNYANASIEDYYDFMEQNDDFIKEYKEIIENEEEEINLNKKNEENNIEENFQIMLSDIDTMLKEIQELKSRINDFKLKNKIKTKRDYLKYMNLIDKNNNNNINNNINDTNNILYKSQNKFYNKLEKNFKKNSEEEKYSQYKKYLIPKESQKEKDFINIKEKLQRQEDAIKKFEENQMLKEKEKENNDKINDINDINDADIYVNNNKCTGDEDVDKLFNEIKLADMKMDSYLKDIDECLLMNENIEKQLDEDEKINPDNEKNEDNLNKNKNNNNNNNNNNL